MKKKSTPKDVDDLESEKSAGQSRNRRVQRQKNINIKSNAQ